MPCAAAGGCPTHGSGWVEGRFGSPMKTSKPFLPVAAKGSRRRPSGGRSTFANDLPIKLVASQGGHVLQVRAIRLDIVFLAHSHLRWPASFETASVRLP